MEADGAGIGMGSDDGGASAGNWALASAVLCVLLIVAFGASFVRTGFVQRRWEVCRARPDPSDPSRMLIDEELGGWCCFLEEGSLALELSDSVSTYDSGDPDVPGAVPLKATWDVGTEVHGPMRDATGGFLGFYSFAPVQRKSLIPSPRTFTSKVHVIAVPFLPVIFLCALFPGVWLWRQGLRDAGTGMCANCGYDLRAHRRGERCPECGGVIGGGSEA